MNKGKVYEKNLKFISMLVINLLVIIIYFFLNSKELFTILPNSYFPNLYYPFGIILSIFVSYILCIFFFQKIKWIFLIQTGVSISLLVMFTVIIQFLFTPILEHYYQYNNDNLFGIIDYSHQKGSYIKIYRWMREIGIYTTDIGEGYKNALGTKGYSSYTSQVTYDINNKHIIIVDWSAEKVINVTSKREIQNDMISFLSNIFHVDKNEINILYFTSCYFRVEVGDRNFQVVYVYPEDGEFKFALKK